MQNIFYLLVQLYANVYEDIIRPTNLITIIFQVYHINIILIHVHVSSETINTGSKFVDCLLHLLRAHFRENAPSSI